MINNKRFVYKIYRQKTIKRIENKLKLLGNNAKINSLTFLNTRAIISLIIFALLLTYTKPGYLIAPIFTILFYIFSEKFFLNYPIKKRSKKLESEAIFFFEVLNLTLESNRNLKKALELTSKNIDSELSEEFKKTLAESKMGKSFNESLKNMKERIPSDIINNIILNLTEAGIFGNSITVTLNNQLDYLREKEILDIKGEIAKLPTKISVISVLFFIPIMLLIILSPIILELLSK